MTRRKTENQSYGDQTAKGVSFDHYQKWWVTLSLTVIAGDNDITNSYEFGESVFCALDEATFTGFTIDMSDYDHDDELGFYVEVEKHKASDIPEMHADISRQLHKVVVDLYESCKESDEDTDPIVESKIGIAPDGQYYHSYSANPWER